MRTTIQQLAEFLTACRGNWRNACFISCNECKCHSPCSGYLMSADADGKPVLIPAAEYERLTAQRIDPSECRGNISRSAFEDIYALYLNWCLSDDESCCLQIAWMLSLLHWGMLVSLFHSSNVLNGILNSSIYKILLPVFSGRRIYPSVNFGNYYGLRYRIGHTRNAAMLRRRETRGPARK